MQFQQYSQRTLNNRHHCVTCTDEVTICIFDPLPISEFRYEANETLTLHPRNIVHYFALTEVSNRLLPSSKTLHFQNEAKCTTLPVK